MHLFSEESLIRHQRNDKALFLQLSALSQRVIATVRLSTESLTSSSSQKSITRSTTLVELETFLSILDRLTM